MTKDNALWNTAVVTTETWLKDNPEIKRIASEAASLKETAITLQCTALTAKKAYIAEAEKIKEKVKELHKTAIGPIDKLQEQITESTKTITTFHDFIAKYTTALEKLRDEQETAATSYKAASGGNNDRHKRLEKVQASLHSYKKVVEGAGKLHTRANTNSNQLQGQIDVVMSAIDLIIKSISDLSKPHKTLRATYYKHKDEFTAAVKASKKKEEDLKVAKEAALLLLADKITITKGRGLVKQALIKVLEEEHKFQNWTCETTDNRQLRSQVEGILCIFVDLPIFFSREEFETLLGYKANNNNVKKALHRMLESNMIISKDDPFQTQKYFPGTVAMAILGINNIPNIEVARPAEHEAAIQKSMNNGTAHGIKRSLTKKRKATESLDTQAATAASAATMVSPPPRRTLTFKDPPEQEKKVEDSTSSSVSHSVCDLTGTEEQEETEDDWDDESKNDESK